MTEWLIDKSALTRLGDQPDAAEWAERISRGLVRIATVTVLEIGYSARSPAGWHALVQGLPVAHMPVELLTPAAERRAVEVQGMLAHRGKHRAPSVADLLIAAIAEESGLCVVHLDKDFELIADVTGQPVRRLGEQATGPEPDLT